MTVFVERGHLGGYIAGGDPATFQPALWRWLIERYGVESVLDVGCGEGQAVDWFASHGISALGIEGVPQPHRAIVEHDFTKGPPFAVGAADLVWCCEVVEHIEARYLPNLLAAFKVGRVVAMTHADPGQPGYHHVNCRTAEYWEGALAAIGFRLDPYTGEARRVAARGNPNPHNHFARSGLVFVKA